MSSGDEMKEFFARVLREVGDPDIKAGSEGPVENQSRRSR
jgi:hypothetical protein